MLSLKPKFSWVCIGFLCLTNFSQAEATIKYTSFGDPIKWKKSEVNICLTEESKKIKGIHQAVQESINSWNKTDVTPKLRFDKSECDIYIKYSRVVLGYPPPVAISTITYKNGSGRSLNSDITLNTYYNNLLGDASKEKSKYDLQGVVTHELGHSFGLNEDFGDPNSSMYGYVEPGSTTQRYINDTDIKAMCKIYTDNCKPQLTQLKN
jgi:predicted Zn-dependent protease